VVLTAAVSGRAGLAEYFQRLTRWKVNPWVAVVAIFSPAAMFVLSAVIEKISGGSWPEIGRVQFELLPEMSFWGGLIFITLTYGLGEEAGWRGFALPQLQSRYTAMQASMVLSFGWAGWHLPMFFYKGNFLSMGLSGAFGWLVSLMFGTVFLTWMYNAGSGSILMPAIWHGCFDLFTASSMGDGLAPMMMSIVLMVGVFWIVRRYKREDLSDMPRQTAFSGQGKENVLTW